MKSTLALACVLPALHFCIAQCTADGAELASCHSTQDAEPSDTDVESLLQSNLQATSSMGGLLPPESESQRSQESMLAQNKATASHGSSEKPETASHEDPAHFTGEAGGLEEVSLARYVIFPVCFAIMMSFFLGRLIERFEVTWLSESLVTLVLGMCLGFYLESTEAVGSSVIFTQEEVFHKTCSTLLTLFLLPILMFEAGWTLRKRDFASQFEYIILFAVPGSLIAFLVVGALIMYTGRWGFHSIVLPRAAFVYASLVAATDPVATLATYSSLRVDPLLNILVFGDSTFNDAVAITLFKVLNDDDIMHTPGDRPHLDQLARHVLGGIAKIFVGSFLLGITCAALFLICLRVLHMRESPRSEILACTAMAYITFAIGEAIGMSGIIATIFCSMLLGIYARPHLSVSGSLLSDFFISQLSTLMDRMVFLLTGFCVVAMGTKDWSGYTFGLWTMLFCLVGRAAAVFPMGIISNMIKRRIGMAEGKREEDWHLISPGAMFMIWHAALRGAISLTLCMEIGDWADRNNGPETRKILQTSTFFMICVFLLVFGGSTESFLKKLGIPMGDESSRDKLYRTEVTTWAQKCCAWVDTQVAMPLFVGTDRDPAHVYRRSDSTVAVEDFFKGILPNDWDMATSGSVVDFRRQHGKTFETN